MFIIMGAMEKTTELLVRRSIASERDLRFPNQFVLSECLREHTWDKSSHVVKGLPILCDGLAHTGEFNFHARR